MDIDKYKILLTDSAKVDLEDIYQYISDNLLEISSANRLMEKIENEILLLEHNPYACIEIIVKPHKKKYRRLVIGKYVVLYRIDEDKRQVIVTKIIYGKRDYLV